MSQLRVGECIEEDIVEVQILVLTNPKYDVLRCDVILVTPRNAAKKLWNAAALQTQFKRLVIENI